MSIYITSHFLYAFQQSAYLLIGIMFLHLNEYLYVLNMWGGVYCMCTGHSTTGQRPLEVLEELQISSLCVTFLIKHF